MAALAALSLSCGIWELHCVVWAFSSWCINRLVVAQQLIVMAHRLSIWGAWAWLLRDMWDLSTWPGIKSSCFARRTLNHWTTREVPYYDNYNNNASECFLCGCNCWVVQSCLTLRPNGLQHVRLPCPSPTPRAYSNSCSLSGDATQPSSVAPFSSCLQSFPASGSSLMSWLFTSGGRSIGVSASALVLPMNIQVWFPLGLWIHASC